MRSLIYLLLLSLISFVRAEDHQLKGRVVDDESGAPLYGAIIQLAGADRATSTGRDGYFVLDRLPTATAHVQVRFMGYESLEETMTLPRPSPDAELFRLKSTILPLQSVLITATRSRELQFPASQAQMQQQEIQQRYTVQDIPVLLSELPSTTFYSESGNGIGYTYLNMRGFDQRRIAVLINGVPQNDPEDHSVYWLDFPDLAANLENIQVQRGAGNLWGGTPAIGGSINLITSNFTRQRGISVFTGGGTYNTRKMSMSASSGLLDEKYAIYARLGRITSDGYRHNSWVEFNSYFLGAARFGKNSSLQINLYGGPVADHLAYYGIAKAGLNDRAARKQNPISRPEEIENFSQPHYELIHEWRLGGWKLSNTLFYVKGEGFFNYDGSWAPYSYYRITPENGFAIADDPQEQYIPDALIHANVLNQQGGWLPRAQWQHNRGTLTLGGEARWHRSLHYGSLAWGRGLPAGVTPDYRYYEYRGGKNMFSVFANETYQATARLSLLAEGVLVAHSYRLYDEKYLGTDFKAPYRFFNPKLGANYQFSSAWQAFASFARTSREPRLKNLYDAAEASTPASWGAVLPQFAVQANGGYDFSRPLVKEETMYNGELGGGYRGESVSLLVNFYRMAFRNEIVKNGQLDRFGQPVTGNAEQTVHQGVELMLQARPNSTWEFAANTTLSRNRFEKQREYTWDGVLNLDGATIAGFPELLANARATFHDGPFTISLAARHVGGFFTTNYEEAERKVQAYTIANFMAAYRMPAWSAFRSVEFQLHVNNLFDKLYATNGEKDEYFPAATRNVFLGINWEL